jgi:RNA polymerase sigma-70 factor (ECF subfamily)
MDGLADGFAGSVVSLDAPLEREFEQRLADCPTLAFRVALSVLRNRAEAEDIAQEAMLRAYRKFHRLRDRDKFRAWLVRMTWRLALDRIRSTTRRERREQASADTPSATSPEEVAASNEFSRNLRAAIDALPEKLRIALVLSAIEGRDVREVSRLMEIPEGTVKSRIHLARKQLAEALDGL